MDSKMVQVSKSMSFLDENSYCTIIFISFNKIFTIVCVIARYEELLRTSDDRFSTLGNGFLVTIPELGVKKARKKVGHPKRNGVFKGPVDFSEFHDVRKL